MRNFTERPELVLMTSLSTRQQCPPGKKKSFIPAAGNSHLWSKCHHWISSKRRRVLAAFTPEFQKELSHENGLSCQIIMKIIHDSDSADSTRTE
jgi:hypothetical protein